MGRYTFCSVHPKLWKSFKIASLNFLRKNYFYITLLKIKNEMNSIWITFNSTPLIKPTFPSWVDFIRLSHLKKCFETWITWVNTNLLKIKSELSEVSAWVFRTYNRICTLDINAQNCTELCPLFYPQQQNWIKVC